MRGRHGITWLAVLAAGACLSAPRRAEAQWWGYGGYGGYGYSFGYGAGYAGYPYGGGYGAIGMSPYDQDMIKAQTYSLNQSRYDLQNAQAVQAYAAADAMNQQAIATALANQKNYDAIQEKYDLKARAAKQQAAADRRVAVLDHLGQVIDTEGKALWPQTALTDGDLAASRQSAEDAIRYVYREYKANGQAGVKAVVDAGHKLHEYGEPALHFLRVRNQRAAATDLRNFLNQLDESIAGMGGPPPKK